MVKLNKRWQQDKKINASFKTVSEWGCRFNSFELLSLYCILSLSMALSVCCFVGGISHLIFNIGECICYPSIYWHIRITTWLGSAIKNQLTINLLNIQHDISALHVMYMYRDMLTERQSCGGDLKMSTIENRNVERWYYLKMRLFQHIHVMRQVWVFHHSQVTLQSQFYQLVVWCNLPPFLTHLVSIAWVHGQSHFCWTR